MLIDTTSYTRHDYVAANHYRQPSSGQACNKMHDGYTCTVPAGDEHTRHVAATSDRLIVHTWDEPEASRLNPDDDRHQLTLLDGSRVTLPADLYPTARDELNRYTRQADELRAQLAMARDEVANLRSGLDSERERTVHLHQRLADQAAQHEQAMEAFKARVAEVAMREARRHDWCSVVQRALAELDIEVKQRFRIGTKVKLSYGEWDVVMERVEIEVESAKDSNTVYQDVDAMDADDAVEALNAVGFYVPDGMEFRGFDAETYSELVEG